MNADNAMPHTPLDSPPPACRFSIPGKMLLTFIACVIVLAHVGGMFGPAYFLYLCIIALMATVLGMWKENPLLLSMSLTSTAVIFVVWVIDIAGGLLFGQVPFDVAGYMLDPHVSRWVKALSLFHLWLPLLLFWAVGQLGYCRWAFCAQTLLAWTALLLCYFFTRPELNINYVTGFTGTLSLPLSGPAWLLFLMAFMPLCIYLPAHLFFRWWFPAIVLENAPTRREEPATSEAPAPRPRQITSCDSNPELVSEELSESAHAARE